MPNTFAVASLDPASLPATTQLVFFETDPATFAPKLSRSAFASLRDKCSKVPVKTHVCPASKCSSLAGAFFSLFQ